MAASGSVKDGVNEDGTRLGERRRRTSSNLSEARLYGCRYLTSWERSGKIVGVLVLVQAVRISGESSRHLLKHIPHRHPTLHEDKMQSGRLLGSYQPKA